MEQDFPLKKKRNGIFVTRLSCQQRDMLSTEKLHIFGYIILYISEKKHLTQATITVDTMKTSSVIY